MAYFMKLVDDDGSVSYINLEMISEVDVDSREVTLSTGEAYSFDDDLNGSEWNHVMRFIGKNEYR